MIAVACFNASRSRPKYVLKYVEIQAVIWFIKVFIYGGLYNLCSGNYTHLLVQFEE